MEERLSSMSRVRSAHADSRLALSPAQQIGLRVSLHLCLDLQATLLRKLTLNLDQVSCMYCMLVVEYV